MKPINDLLIAHCGFYPLLPSGEGCFYPPLPVGEGWGEGVQKYVSPTLATLRVD